MLERRNEKMTHLEKQIQRELSSMDDKLFLDYDRHPAYGFLYYSVKRLMEPGIMPLTVVDWCVGATPLPLSMDIVSMVRSQEGDIREAISQATANNAAKAELERQRRHAEQENVIDEWKARAKKL